MVGFKTKVTPEIENLTEVCKEHTSLDLSLYAKYDVKRGLRDINGKGVLAGLTQVSNVKATKIVDGKEVPCAGSLSYRGYDIKDLTRDLSKMTDMDLKKLPIFYYLAVFRIRNSLQILHSFWQISGHFLQILCVML